MARRKRIVAAILLISAVLAALNVYRGPHLLGEYAKYVMLGVFALNFGWLYFFAEWPASDSETEESQLSTREWVRRKPFKAAITIVVALAVPFAIAWIKNDFDWTVLALVELVFIGIMIDMWYRDKPMTRKG